MAGMDFSPINVTIFATGAVLLYAAKENRSPINVIKASFGLEEPAQMSGGGGNKLQDGIDKRREQSKPGENFGWDNPEILPQANKSPSNTAYITPYAVPRTSGYLGTI